MIKTSYRGWELDSIGRRKFFSPLHSEEDQELVWTAIYYRFPYGGVSGHGRTPEEALAQAQKNICEANAFHEIG